MAKWARFPNDERLALYDLLHYAWHSEHGIPTDQARAARQTGIELETLHKVWADFLAECVERNGYLRLREMWQGIDSYKQRAQQRKEAGQISAFRRQEAKEDRETSQTLTQNSQSSSQNLTNTANNKLSTSSASVSPQHALQQTNDLQQRTVDESSTARTRVVYDSSTELELELELELNTNKTKEKNKTKKEKSFSSTDVDIVFRYWQQETGKLNHTLTPGRRAKVEARLREGKTVEDIKSGIRGCCKSLFHQGLTDASNGTVYNDLELICRSGTKLEEFMEMDKQASQLAQRKAGSWLNGSAGARFAFAATGQKLGAPGTDRPDFQRLCKQTGDWIDKRMLKLAADSITFELSAEDFVDFWQMILKFNGFPTLTSVPKYFDQFAQWVTSDQETPEAQETGIASAESPQVTFK
jgi:hypothetical protein